MDKFNIKITTKNGKTYNVNNLEYSSFRAFATNISIGGFVVFNDIMINSKEIEAIEQTYV